MARALGVTEHVTSPTFVILKKYQIESRQELKSPEGLAFGAKNLIHIDAYRLEGKHDLKLLDYDNITANPKNLVLIEWPENVGLTKSDIPFLSFTFIDETTREISW